MPKNPDVDPEFERLIDQITESSQHRIESIISAYESFLLDEEALKAFSTLLGEIPMINGAGNEHKKDA